MFLWDSAPTERLKTTDFGPKISMHQALFLEFDVGTTRKSSAYEFLSSWLVKLNEMGFLLLLAWVGAAQAQFSAHHQCSPAYLRLAIYMDEPCSISSCFSFRFSHLYCRFCDHVWDDGFEVSSNQPSKTFDPFQEEGMSSRFTFVIPCQASREFYVVYMTSMI